MSDGLVEDPRMGSLKVTSVERIGCQSTLLERAEHTSPCFHEH